MRSCRFAPLLAGLLAVGVSAQGSTQAPEPPQPEASNWDFAASVHAYYVPNDRDYMQPTFMADRRWLHLEARYNYEDLESGSVWFGYNYSIGEKVSLAMTPVFGGVIGKTAAIAFGYRVSIDWRWLELYTEGEVVLDTGPGDNTFFYSWSELTLSPLDWLKAGLVAQRTHVFQTEREIQPGILLGVRLEPIGITGHVFDPDLEPTVVISIDGEF